MNRIDLSAENAAKTLPLPTGAPRIRVTAGSGSVAQKTWNLRRPVTLIGSHRPAHILLHDRDVSRAHCAIIHTGKDILLKDLHSRTGTYCNKTRVDLALLADGDVIAAGASRIQVAIQIPESGPDDSACGASYVDPTSLPNPVALGLAHTDQTWMLREAVTLLGRHDMAAIRLEHEQVSPRHAIIFRFEDGTAIFDLGGEGGIAINGQPCMLALLADGDRITVGPFTLMVGSHDPKSMDLVSIEDSDSGVQHEDVSAEPICPQQSSPIVEPLSEPLLDAPTDATAGLATIEAQLDGIRNDISGSWDRLNTWEAQLQQNTSALSKKENDLGAQGEALDARDAAIRGQLHDVSRCHEQLAAREQEIAAELRHLQEEKDALATRQAEVRTKDAELARRTNELTRREHVLAQRWTRLYASNCPHCQHRIGTPESGAPGQSS